MDLKAIFLSRCKLPGQLTKTLLIMKLTAILLFAFAMQVSARGYSQRISLKVKDLPLEKVFLDIGRQSGYHFVYSDEVLERRFNLTLEISNASLEEALALCLKGHSLTYVIVDKIVVIKPLPNAAPPVEQSLPPPRVDVKGRIVNAKGEPVVGATVSIKGSKGGTATDGNGEFILKGLKDNAVLVITSVGYQPQEVSVQGRTELTITMAAGSQSMEEMVVVGYGAKKRGNLTGAVSTVTSEVIKSRPITNVASALQE